MGNSVGKGWVLHFLWVGKSFARTFAVDLRKDFQMVLHTISTYIICSEGLAIDFLLDFLDLIAEGEVEFELLSNFFNAMHDGGVIFDTDFIGDFGGAEI